MTLWEVTDCGCTQDVYLGKKRERFCEHGRLFQRVREDGSKVTGIQPGRGFEASPAQRLKVAALVCAGCGKEAIPGVQAIDPAHLWPRSKGGCDKADCVIPLCRIEATGEGCHRLFDQGRLDLVPRFADSEAWQVEQAHPILFHGVSPVELVRRLSGGSYDFVRVESPNEAAA